MISGIADNCPDQTAHETFPLKRPGSRGIEIAPLNHGGSRKWMVDLIQSESICQIDLMRIGIIWIGMPQCGKSYVGEPVPDGAVFRTDKAVRFACLKFV